MNLKQLIFLNALQSEPPVDPNLLWVDEENVKRLPGSYTNWTTDDGVVYITGAARGGYYATIETNVWYTFSWEADFGDSVSFAMRVWKDFTPTTIGTAIVDQSNVHEKTFIVESDVDEEIEIVCGFYCNSTFGSAGRVLSNLRLVETGV